MTLRELKKNNIIVDTGVLLEYFKLLIGSKYNKLSKFEQNQLTQFIEFFKGRNLYIIPQVLAELYSLLKRDAKDSKSKINLWLKIIEAPHLKSLLEIYVPKEEILEENKYFDFGFTDIALMKTLDKNNLLLTNDSNLIRFCISKGLEARHIEEILIY